MQIWQDTASLHKPFYASSVAIGMFDGVHLGHQALIGAAVADARNSGWCSVVFTFDKHPAELLAPERAPGYLTTGEQRASLISALGVDHLVVAQFTGSLRSMQPIDFLRSILRDRLNSHTVLVGADFKFGKNQSGDVELIRSMQEELGYRLIVVEPVEINHEKAASTRIRQLLRKGDLQNAVAMLGHPYILSGTVVDGDKLGRKLGYPTANIGPIVNQVIPQDGVYSVRILTSGERLNGVCSIGNRPTVNGTARVIEIHILDFSANIYGQTIHTEFVARLRGQQKFGSVNALVEQMSRDVKDARRTLTSQIL